MNNDKFCIDKIKNINSRKSIYINDYLKRLYSIYMTKIESKDNIIFNNLESDNKSIVLEQSIIQEIIKEPYYEIDNKNDAYKLADYVINTLHEMLEKEIIKYPLEELLIVFYSIADELSNLSIRIKNEDKKIENIENIEDLIINIINKGLVEHISIMGKEKKATEYLLNYIIANDIQSGNKSVRKIDISKLYDISNKIIEMIMYRNSINNMFKIELRIIVKNQVIDFSKAINEKQDEYFSSILDMKYKLNEKEHDKIYKEFEKVEGYSPEILLTYFKSVSLYKKKESDSDIIITRQDTLINNMTIVTKEDEKTIKKLIEAITFKGIDNSTLTSDKGIYKAPILQIKGYYIYSCFLLTESYLYLKKRILTGKLSNSGAVKNKIKKYHDEVELSELKQIIIKKNLIGNINFHLNHYKELEPLLQEKDIKKEIDFYFIDKNILYLMEYKNYDIDKNFHEIGKTYQKSSKDLYKLNKLINIMKDNITLFGKVLGKEFSSIQPFLVFKQKNSFSTFNKDPQIIAAHYPDFKDWVESYEKKDS